MTYTTDRLVEIAEEEYSAAGIAHRICAEGVGEWARASSSQDYRDEAEVRAELRGYVADEIEAEVDREPVCRQWDQARSFCWMIWRSGLKKAAIAVRCGVTPTTISRYCSGKSTIPPLVWREVVRMADAVK